MDLGLQGKVALVSGGSKGLGQAIALELAQEGAEIAICSRNRAEIEAAGAEIAGRCGRAVLAHSADVTRPEDVARFVAAAAQRFGGIDILVNNAGLGWAGPLTEISAAQVTELAAVNLTAPIELTRLLVPGMAARGRGAVAFVSSIAAVTGVRGEAVYAATKAGLAAFAESLRYEVRGRGVGVSVIVPAVIDTPFFDRRGRPYERARPAPVPARRVAAAIVSALEHGRPVVYVPGWMRFPAWLHGTAPGAFRALAARLGDPGH